MYSSYKNSHGVKEGGRSLIGVLSLTENGVVKADIIMMSGPLFN